MELAYEEKMQKINLEIKRLATEKANIKNMRNQICLANEIGISNMVKISILFMGVCWCVYRPKFVFCSK